MSAAQKRSVRPIMTARYSPEPNAGIVAFSSTICNSIVVKKRRFWLQTIEDLWSRKSVLWLAGVRRSGKTVLSRTIPDSEYFDCELPRTRRLLGDPEGFLKELRGRRIVLDEIHRLDHPSEILKIAADHFPDVKIAATGSSSLGASRKFRDTLTGRKAELWLTPMIRRDLDDFEDVSLSRRFLRGGLPPYFLAPEIPEKEFAEWLDAYWAKDILELFRLEQKHSFQKLLELILAQSGGIFEATRLARACEVSRTTVMNYLAVLEATFTAHIIRPFSGRASTEIVSAPKVYGFDSGFVCHVRGWSALRDDDRGTLWEHFVLNELQGRLQTRSIHYWRDKHGHEVDFVIARRGQAPIGIECKWSAGAFDDSGLRSFRGRHREGRNYVVAADVERGYSRERRELLVHYVSLEGLLSALSAPVISA